MHLNARFRPGGATSRGTVIAAATMVRPTPLLWRTSDRRPRPDTAAHDRLPYADADADAVVEDR
jgi:hypothetical protein